MEQYKEYIGKEYSYGNKNFCINKIKNVQQKIVVKTSHRTYVFYPNDAIDFFNDLKPYVKKQFKMSSLQHTTQIKDNQYDDEIKNILFDAISKVKNDVDYVKQANAICNITSQLIAIKKLELLNK